MAQSDITAPVQIKSLSTMQDELHPSRLAVFLSSQPVELVSLPIRTPSPQMGAHWLRLPTIGHFQYCYSAQEEEHPSPLTRLPSSQFSGFISLPTRILSPHLGSHMDLYPWSLVQTQRGSTVQFLRHPVSGPRIPVSQTYPVWICRMPFPQINRHLEGVPKHLAPFSILQIEEQPSPSTVFPSSQALDLTSF